MATMASGSTISSNGFRIARSISEYTENEKEYSQIDRINSIVEWKRFNTLSAVDSLQKGLIPTWLSFDWVVPSDDSYFENEKDVVSRDLDITIVRIKGISNNLWKSTDRYMNDTMLNLYNDKRIQPILLFIDNLFVPWSKFRVVKSDKFVSLLIERDRWTKFKSIRILSIPFLIHYSENDNAQPLYARLFGFDFDGKYNSNGPIQINPESLRIGAMEYEANQFLKKDVGIPANRYYTPLNIFKFNEDGSLHADNNSDIIYNSGILTLNAGTVNYQKLVVIYSLFSNLNESISMRANDKSYTKKIMKGDVTVPSLDVDQFNTSFDFKFYKTTDYTSNLRNGFDYTFYTDVNKFDGVFEHVKHLNIVEYDYNTLPKVGNTITMQMDICVQYPHQSYPIIFINGLADTFVNNSIEYHGNQFTFSTASITYPVETFEIVFIKNNINGKYDPVISAGYIDLTNCIIPQEDVVLLTDDGDPNGPLYPVPSSRTGNVLMPNDPTLLTNTKLWICSRYQFIHKQFHIDNNVVILGKEFETAYNYKKFMVFADGRYINPNDYKVIYPDLSATYGSVPIPAIYFKFETGIFRYIDVYYVSSLPLGEIDPFGDLLIDCRKVKCTERQQAKFIVPYPFPNYPRSYDSFFCIKNSLYVDKSRYTIDGDYIIFNDPEDEDFFVMQDLIFVFPYYKDEFDDDSAIKEEDMVNYKYYKTTTSFTTSTVTFSDYPVITPGESTLLFINTTYIDKSRYTLSGNTITMLNGELIEDEKVVTLVVETNPINLIGNIVIKEVDEVTIESGKRIYAITRPQYSDSFFIVLGSLVISPNRYYVNIYTNEIIFIHDYDVLPVGRTLYFVYFRSITDSGAYSSSGTEHIVMKSLPSTVEIKTKVSRIQSNLGRSFKPNKDNILLFVNGTFYNSGRYTVDNNMITLTHPDDYFMPGCDIEVLYAFVSLKYNHYSFDPNSHDVIWFEEKTINVEYDGQVRYQIPYPLKGVYDTEFIVALNSVFIPAKYYTVSDGYITFEDDPVDPVNFIRGMELEFNFIHNNGYTYIAKSETTVPITAGQKIIDIPSPYQKLVNLDRRMMVFYNGTYVDKDQYTIDNIHKQIEIIDSYGIRYEDSEITFVFFYTGTGSNGAVAYLSESGYFSIRQAVINRNFNNRMLLVFVNGSLIPASQIMNISNSIFKVTKDIQSRYDLNVLCCSPIISELKDKYSVRHDLWHNTIKYVPVTVV